MNSPRKFLLQELLHRELPRPGRVGAWQRLQQLEARAKVRLRSVITLLFIQILLFLGSPEEAEEALDRCQVPPWEWPAGARAQSPRSSG